MRPKLVPNYTFTAHKSASLLRDNIEPSSVTAAVTAEQGAGESGLPNIPLAREAIKEDIGDDRLGDEEWNLISAAR